MLGAVPLLEFLAYGMKTKTFELPADGFIQLMPFGEFPHKGAGVVQVLDKIAGAEILKNLRPLLGKDSPLAAIDFDHYSDLTTDERASLEKIGVQMPSDAAGWMMDAEMRDDGIWIKPEFTASGLEKIEGGEYRFLSPNFPIADLEPLGKGRVRPHSIRKAGLTNEPNLTGISALTNRVGAVGLIGPACVLENRANIKPENTTMDYKAELCEMLGIDPASDDAAILAAVQAANDKAAALENQAKDAQAEKDMADLEKEGASICNREDVKAGLLANREATLKAIRAVKVVSLPNRADGVPPVDTTPADKQAEQTKAVDAACLENRCSRKEGYHFAALKNPALFA